MGVGGFSLTAKAFNQFHPFGAGDTIKPDFRGTI